MGRKNQGGGHHLRQLRQPAERQIEMEKLEEEEEEEDREPDHIDLIMKQTMWFMMNAFQTLKAHKAVTSKAWQIQGGGEDGNKLQCGHHGGGFGDPSHCLNCQAQPLGEPLGLLPQRGKSR